MQYFTTYFLHSIAYITKGTSHFTQANSATPKKSDITTFLIYTDLKSIAAFGKL